MTLILASTSPYRQQLLARLSLPFSCLAPGIIETPVADESASDMVQRLAREKAQAIVQHHPEATVIGSDQAAVIDGQIIGKPDDHQQAVKQLTAASGKAVIFYTALAVHHGPSGQWRECVEPFSVYFRSLTEAQIEHYLRLERPYHCAGSFKSEGLGITLFERFSGRDPNTLIGLPLMALIDILAELGIDVLTEADAVIPD